MKATTSYVTHDRIEAMTLADRVVVMNKGAVQHVGTPLDIYDRPANTFVAGFIGSPAMILLKGRMTGGVYEAEHVRIPGFESAPDGPVTLGFRAEDARVTDAGEISSPVYSMELPGDSSIPKVQGMFPKAVVISSTLPWGSALIFRTKPEHGRPASEIRQARIRARSSTGSRAPPSG